MLNKLMQIWKRYNPFDIASTINDMVSKFDYIEHKLDTLQKSLLQEISFYKAELEIQQHILFQIGNSLPNMVWYKDISGKYLYTNNPLKDGNLFHENPIGKTDIELSDSAIRNFGKPHHTFLESCLYSDSIVLKTGRPMRFLEHGFIKDKVVLLEIYKNVVKNQNGEVIGICGTCRNLTDITTNNSNYSFKYENGSVKVYKQPKVEVS